MTTIYVCTTTRVVSQVAVRKSFKDADQIINSGASSKGKGSPSAYVDSLELGSIRFGDKDDIMLSLVPASAMQQKRSSTHPHDNTSVSKETRLIPSGVDDLHSFELTNYKLDGSLKDIQNISVVLGPNLDKYDNHPNKKKKKRSSFGLTRARASTLKDTVDDGEPWELAWIKVWPTLNGAHWLD